MSNFKKLINLVVGVALITSMIGFVGCGPSEEELAQLQQLREEVSSLEQEVTTLKSEKTKLEREVAEKNAKLAECAKKQDETKKNLKKLGL